MEHHWKSAEEHHLAGVRNTEKALIDVFQTRKKASLERRIARINQLSELIQRRADIEARTVFIMRGLNDINDMAGKEVQNECGDS